LFILSSRGDVTRLLADLSAGKKDAEMKLLPLVYEELHDLAKRYMRNERLGHTLQTTALIHEAYIHLGGGKDANWESRAHFLRVAAQAMRRVLISHARRKRSEKRAGVGRREPLKEDAAVLSAEPSASLHDLDEALNQLAEMDQQTGQVFELRYFGGLTAEETARVMGISVRTVMREWKIARAWLAKKIG
jgi:RNA polymerase sigma factor (TIGR02999 family)